CSLLRGAIKFHKSSEAAQQPWLGTSVWWKISKSLCGDPFCKVSPLKCLSPAESWPRNRRRDGRSVQRCESDPTSRQMSGTKTYSGRPGAAAFGSMSPRHFCIRLLHTSIQTKHPRSISAGRSDRATVRLPPLASETLHVPSSPIGPAPLLPRAPCCLHP